MSKETTLKLKSFAEMVDLEHANYLKHDKQVFKANRRPYGMYYIHLRNNARIRRDRWQALLVAAWDATLPKTGADTCIGRVGTTLIDTGTES